MKKTSTSTKRTRTIALSESEEAMCEYYCSLGVWTLAGMTGGPEYECADNLIGNCTENDHTYVPAVYVGGSNRLAASSSPTKSFPKNSGEYIYRKGDKSIRLIRGECAKGRFLQSEIPLKNLAKIDPSAADFIKAAAKQKVTSVQIIVAAQKIAKK